MTETPPPVRFDSEESARQEGVFHRYRSSQVPWFVWVLFAALFIGGAIYTFRWAIPDFSRLFFAP